MKSMLQQITPPLVWRLASRLHRQSRRDAAGAQQDAAFYDATFERASHWKLHYTESRYYPLWTLIADRVRRSGGDQIIDIGCGPGQFGCLLRDQGITHYVGLDFSAARVECARTVCPEFEFVVADVLEGEHLQTLAYSTALLMEFLEHIDDDLGVLGRLRPGTHVLATVPDFPDAAHVRHFRNVDDVRQRYAGHIESLTVDTVLANPMGKTYFVLEGTAP